MSDLTPKRQKKAGAPAWMATFADLATLLMCFFVLLLAFSEMDVLKFKQIAGSMKYAFGVQNKLDVKDIPRGTSVIAQEFRPGRPEPTPIDVIQQQTVEFTRDMLNYQPGESDEAGGQQNQSGNSRGGSSTQTANQPREQARAPQSAQAASASDADHVNDLAKKIAHQLEDQILDGAIEVESLGQQIIIRIREKGAFPAGSAFLQPRFRPVIHAVGNLLKDVPGIVSVTGHSDNTSIDNELYRSNWELSSQRAVAVGHELLRVQGFDPGRMELRGVADNEPLVSNDTWEGRVRNRRVEIAINQGKPKTSEEIQVMP
ncbi:flagellar motor protein MotB [Ferrimonas balearica]|uniref:flagellar motor protein MotB n=1 Tax=Ferrimonas balearica TaxID=44012 RepID=UPI001C98F294|nr:flagellar motor protein MotB [Ferrimonas balearica]MBY5990580.1 flagellar motor protein MotB [Ferrimonas balearica]